MTSGKYLRIVLLISGAVCTSITQNAAAQGNKIRAVSDPPPPARPAPKQVFPTRDPITSDKPEAMPIFRGRLADFYAKNLDKSVKVKNSGKALAIVGFVIEATGLVTEVRIIKSSGSLLFDQEAVRVISLMKEKAYWKPGKHQGAPVAVYYELGVRPQTVAVAAPKRPKAKSASTRTQ